MTRDEENSVLTRLRTEHPGWRITKNIPGVARPGFTAVECATGRRIITETVTELETALHIQDSACTA